MTKLRILPASVWGTLLLFFALHLTACGDNGEGNEDTLLTGFSGVVILVIVVWLIWRAAKKNRAG